MEDEILSKVYAYSCAKYGSAVPISFLIVFYLNYCFFIPRFLFEGRDVYKRQLQHNE